MAGFHGKMRCKGDFVTRGLSREVVGQLDEWFQTGMLASKDALQDDWLSFYQVAPIWHCYLSPGIVDDKAWLGVWIPSIDKVGRSFPLALMVPTDKPIDSLTGLAPFDEWLIQCEDLLLSALDDKLVFDHFCASVEQQQPYQTSNPDTPACLIEQAFDTTLPGASNQEPSSLGQSSQEQEKAMSPFEQRLLNLENAVEQIAQHLQIDISLNTLLQVGEGIEQPEPQSAEPQNQQQPHRGYSEFEYNVNLAQSNDLLNGHILNGELTPFCLWHSEGNDAIDQQLMVSKGLPDKDYFCRFLTGFE